MSALPVPRGDPAPDGPLQVKTSTPIVDLRWAGKGENEDQVRTMGNCARVDMPIVREWRCVLRNSHSL